MAEGRSTTRRHGRFRLRRRWRRRIIRVAALLVVVVLAVFAYHATRTALALYRARADAATLKDEVARGEVEGAKLTLSGIAQRSRVAHEQTRGPLWSASTHVPWVGGDLAAVQVLSRSLDAATHASLPTALRVYSQVQGAPLRSSNGQFDLRAIAALAPPLRSLATSLEAPRSAVDAIDAASLHVHVLQRAVVQAQSTLDSLSSMTASGAQAATVLPAMLGGSGPRTYALVVQNNAEMRATGGLPGSIVTLTADQGRLSLGPQHSTTDFHSFAQPVVPLTSAERTLFGTTIATDLRDANITPDFPRSGTFISTMYDRLFHEHVDGVVSVDPVALTGLLRATGPVDLGSAQVTADNVVSVLLNRTYQTLPTDAQQNAFFALAAHRIFGVLSRGQANQTVLIRGLISAVDQRHLLVWSRHPAEQAVLTGHEISGGLPSGTGRAPQVGYYLNDGTARKIEFYLSTRSSVTSVRCSSQGTQQIQASMTLTSSVPAKYLQLSPAIIGYGQFAPRGSMRIIARIYGPAGGAITRVTANGNPVTFQTIDQSGRPVASLDLILGQGQSISITSEFSSGPGQSADPHLEWTPGAQPGPSSRTAMTSCH